MRTALKANSLASILPIETSSQRFASSCNISEIEVISSLSRAAITACVLPISAVTYCKSRLLARRELLPTDKEQQFIAEDLHGLVPEPLYVRSLRRGLDRRLVLHVRRRLSALRCATYVPCR